MKSSLSVFRKSMFAKAVTAALSVAALTAVMMPTIQSARAQSAAQNRLLEVLGGTTKQPVELLDKSGLKLVLNEQAKGVAIEGWSTKALTTAEADALFRQFGVRVTWTGTGDAAYLTPDNVGRAGILEGDVYMKMDGKVYKGLTLKGYGGNNNDQGRGRGAQPNGSLDFAESMRDMEMSNILLEGKADTYLGVLSVDRGGGKANYVRLSRTALRMKDFIRVKGPELAKLTDYMTDLLKDELGQKLSTSEFAEWLAKKTGDLMARKDYIGFKHASITQDNLGIGELVDLGDDEVLVGKQSGRAGMMLPDEYKSQNLEFKEVARSVHENLSKIDAATKAIDFDKLYDSAYKQQLDAMKNVDRARFNLSSATEAELVKAGFTPAEAVEVARFNVSTANGILDPLEVKTIKAITRDVSAILEKATTDFMRMSNGSQLSRYYLRNVGGAEGVRALLEDTRNFMKGKQISLARDAAGKISGNVAAVETELQRLALERASKMGFSRAVVGDSVTSFSKFIARQALEVIVRR